MFDTIRMKTTVLISPGVFQKHGTRTLDVIDKGTGEIRTTYRMSNEKIHYILYSSHNGQLVIETSIPKFLFGNNVRTVDEDDIKQFWVAIQQQLFNLFQVQIPLGAWVVERLDLCCNIQVGALIGDFITQISNKHIPYCKPHLIGRNETVEFKTAKNKRVISCYNKYLECIAKRELPEVIEQAKGILRFEISPSTYELKRYSLNRKASDFLTKRYFDYVMSGTKVQKVLAIQETRVLKGVNLEWALLHYKNIMQIETALGFKALLDANGESKLRAFYNPQTFANRMRLLQQFST